MAPHYMKGNKTTRTPGLFLFVDTETRKTSLSETAGGELHTLRLGHAVKLEYRRGKFSNRAACEFRTPLEFWEWLTQWLNPHRPVWVWAHNMGFDLGVLRFPTFAEQFRWKLKNPVIEGPPTIVPVITELGRFVLLDTLNFWRCPLAKLGESLGFRKMLFPGWDGDESLWKLYCERDVEIIEKAVCGLVELIHANDLGVMQKTGPAQALSTYRHRFMSSTICCHDNKDVTALEREAYRGGRCECFQLGKITGNRPALEDYERGPAPETTAYRFGPLYHLDASALFPSVMRGRRYPAKLIRRVENPTVGELRSLPIDLGIVARVYVCSEQNTYPKKLPQGICYCKGRFWTVLAGPELEAALRADEIGHCSEAAYYITADLFTDYVDYLWSLRQKYIAEGNPAYADMVKLLMNSLYGKFAQASKRWVDTPTISWEADYGEWVSINADTNAITHHRNLCGTLQSREDDWRCPHTFAAVSAYVTSYARLRMDNLRSIAQEGNCLYQAIDSLHVTEQGYGRLLLAGEIAPNQIGKLRVVEQADSAEYHGINDYRFGNSLIIAGIPRHSLPLSEVDYRTTSFDTIKDIFYRNKGQGVITRKVVKHLERDYRQGVVMPDGRVEPFELGELPYA